MFIKDFMIKMQKREGREKSGLAQRKSKKHNCIKISHMGK